MCTFGNSENFSGTSNDCDYAGGAVIGKIVGQIGGRLMRFGFENE